MDQQRCEVSDGCDGGNQIAPMAGFRSAFVRCAGLLDGKAVPVAFALVCITVIYLRRSDPGLVRPFRTPLFPAVPIMGAVMCALLLMSLMSTEHTRNFFLIYLVAGISLYFFYGIRKSKLGRGIVVTGHEPEPFVDLPRKGDLDT